jgi:hypothetical protein
MMRFSRFSFSYSITINYTHHDRVSYTPAVHLSSSFSLDQTDSSFNFTTNTIGCLFRFIGRVFLSLSIFSFIFFSKKKNIQHDTICRVDFDRKAIEHNTIKGSIIHNSVHTQTIEWQNRIYLFFLFDLLLLTSKHNRIDVLQWIWTIEWKSKPNSSL